MLIIISQLFLTLSLVRRKRLLIVGVKTVPSLPAAIEVFKSTVAAQIKSTIAPDDTP